MDDTKERIAALEALSVDRDQQIAEIKQMVSEIHAQLNKYKGFIGAVWFAISCVGIFLSGWKFLHKG